MDRYRRKNCMQYTCMLDLCVMQRGSNLPASPIATTNALTSSNLFTGKPSSVVFQMRVQNICASFKLNMQIESIAHRAPGLFSRVNTFCAFRVHSIIRSRLLLPKNTYLPVRFPSSILLRLICDMDCMQASMTLAVNVWSSCLGLSRSK